MTTTRPGALRCLGALLPLLCLPPGGPMYAAESQVGQDVEIRSTVRPSTVAVGGSFEVMITVSGTQQVDAEPDVPDAGDFAHYFGSGMSTSMTTVNGRMSVEVDYQYRFQAHTEGTFTIQGVVVRVDGRTYRANSVTVTVGNAVGGGGTQGSTTGDGVTSEDLFIETTVSRGRPFENEPVIVEYRLFTRLAVEAFTTLALPQATGFWVEELEQSAEPNENIVRNGVEYVTAVMHRAVLFPTGAGERIIDPMRIEAQVRMPNRRSRDPFGILGSSFFDRRVPVTIASPSESIDVVPLPNTGRPDSFTGHVGALSITASVDRSRVEVHDAITLLVELEGEGNLRALAPPAIDFPPEFEVFPPEITEHITPGGGSIQGVRSFKYVLLPRSAGSLTIPSIEVAYFDPDWEAYRTTRSRPLAISVARGAGDPASGSAGGPSAVTAIREEIRFIHTGNPDLRPIGVPLYRTALFWIVLLAPVGGILGAATLRRHLDRIKGDQAYARLRRAPRMARKRLARARTLRSGDPKDFYGEVAGALQGFLADRLNVSEAGLVRGSVEPLARARGVSPATLHAVFALLDDCDRQRYAPPDNEQGSADEILQRAARLMEDVARELSQ